MNDAFKFLRVRMGIEPRCAQGKSDPPPPPDYAAAARAQGGANVQSSIASNILNNPTQVTPYGTMRRTQTGTFTVPAAEGNAAFDVPTFTSDVQFTPEGAKLFNQQSRISSGVGDIAESGVNRVGTMMASPFSYGNVTDLQNKTQDALLARINPQLAIQREQLDTQLRNQGLAPGGMAWDRAMDVQTRQENDARQQAILAANQARGQALGEESFIRNVPLNELNALRTGAQVTPPTFQGPGNSQIAPAPLFGATQAQGQSDIGLYNAQAAQQGQTMGALGSMAAAAAMFF